MTPPAHLLPLALAFQALDDPEARVVLLDWTEESGWWRANKEKLVTLYAKRWGGLRPDARKTLREDERLARRPIHNSGADWLARAIAAVLLFGSWSTARWPLLSDRQSGRTTRQVQDLIEHLRARPDALGLYVVHSQAMAIYARAVLLRICPDQSVWQRCRVTVARTYNEVDRLIFGLGNYEVRIDHAWRELTR